MAPDCLFAQAERDRQGRRLDPLRYSAKTNQLARHIGARRNPVGHEAASIILVEGKRTAAAP
jgi:hypothetical protein